MAAGSGLAAVYCYRPWAGCSGLTLCTVCRQREREGQQISLPAASSVSSRREHDIHENTIYRSASFHVNIYDNIEGINESIISILPHKDICKKDKGDIRV